MSLCCGGIWICVIACLVVLLCAVVFCSGMLCCALLISSAMVCPIHLSSVWCCVLLCCGNRSCNVLCRLTSMVCVCMCPSNHAITRCFAKGHATYRPAKKTTYSHVQGVDVPSAVLCPVNVPNCKSIHIIWGYGSHRISESWVLRCHLHMQSMCVCSHVFGIHSNRHSTSAFAFAIA